MYKELKIVVKAAVARGWTLTQGRKHYVLVHPSGVKTQVSMSPSDINAHRQLERRIRYKEKEIEESRR